MGSNLKSRLAMLERRKAKPDLLAVLLEELRCELEVISGSVQHRAALAFPFPGMKLRISNSDEEGPPNGILDGQDPKKMRAMVTQLFQAEGMTPEAAAVEAEKYVEREN